MTEQGGKLLGAGCGNREGPEAELLGWAGARLPTSGGLRPLFSKSSHSPGSPGNQENLELKGLIEGKGGGHYCSEQGKASEAALATCKQREELCLEKWKDGVARAQAGHPDPILLTSKVGMHRISKTLPKVAQKAETKRNAVFCTGTHVLRNFREAALKTQIPSPPRTE